MKEVNKIAENLDLQSSAFNVLGVGHEATETGLQTFFSYRSIRSPLNVRRAVQSEYIKHGGNEGVFIPERFYPHITIGFTVRDLFESDGIIKDAAHSLDSRFEIVTQ